MPYRRLHLNDWPLLQKVLIGNTAIVVGGAVLGTFMTIAMERALGGGTTVLLMIGFAGIGVLLSVLVNASIMRAAMSPIVELERVSAAVKRGDYSARVQPQQFSDPQLTRVGESFNGALSTVEAYREQIRQLAHAVITAQESERRRIARELHDDTAQVLFAQLLQLSPYTVSESEPVRDLAAATQERLSEAIESVRRMGIEMRPPDLDDLGLVRSIAALCQRMSERFGFPIDYQATGMHGRLSPDLELVLFRVAQEALTNAWKHSKATAVTVTLHRDDGRVLLTIDDNGVGFSQTRNDATSPTGLGLGLFGMSERIDIVGGTIDIDGHREPGTRVLAEVAVDQ